jgi:hypothetical protein
MKGISMGFIKNSLPIILLASATACVYSMNNVSQADVSKKFKDLVKLEKELRIEDEALRTLGNAKKSIPTGYTKQHTEHTNQYYANIRDFIAALNTEEGLKIANNYCLYNFESGTPERQITSQVAETARTEHYEKKADYKNLLKALQTSPSNKN